MLHKVLSFIILISIACTFITTNTGCALMVPPTGGPRDSTAPKVVKVLPNEKALNVKDKKIVFEFDEYVQLEDASNKIMISPLPKTTPEINSKLKTVTIKLKDSLEENTTYSIAINGAIKDVNEGNKLNDLVYTFSTGNSIDSNTISGKVIMAETGKIDSNLIVCLYNNFEDSAVIKERPKYVAKLDGKGNFEFKNLPAKQFSIFTYNDEGGQKKYTSPKQVFGFNDAKVDAGINQGNILLNAYVEEKEMPKPTKDQPIGADVRIKLTNNLVNGQQDVLKDLILFSNVKLFKLDTTKIILTDTNFTKNYSKNIQIDSLNKQITIATNWQPNSFYKLIVEKDFAKNAKDSTLRKTDTLTFVSKSDKDYGKVTIRFNNMDLNKKPVLQIVQNDNIVKSVVVNAFKINIALFNPGEYELRVLYDENGNGKWDPGSYFIKRKQPEKVVFIEKILNVKADWDNELDVEDKL